MLDKGLITAVSVDTTQTEPLLRLLDTAVIKLEDGTEEDLKALDEKPIEIVKPIEQPPAQPLNNGRGKLDGSTDLVDWSKRVEKLGIMKKSTATPIVHCDDDWDEDSSVKKVPKTAAVIDDDWKKMNPNSNSQTAVVDCDDDWDSEYPEPVPTPVPAPRERTEDNEEDKSKETDKAQNEDDENGAESVHDGENDKEARDEEINSEKIRKRKRSNSNSSSSSSSSSDSDSEDKPDDVDDKSKDVDDVKKLENPEKETTVGDKTDTTEADVNEYSPEKEIKSEKDDDEKMEEKVDDKKSGGKDDAVDATNKINDESKTVEESKETEDDEIKSIEEKMDVDEIDKNEDDIKSDEATKANDEKEIEKTETIDVDKEKDVKENAPRHLHRTSSIFLRNLAPTITKAEVEAVFYLNPQAILSSKNQCFVYFSRCVKNIVDSYA